MPNSTLMFSRLVLAIACAMPAGGVLARPAAATHSTASASALVPTAAQKGDPVNGSKLYAACMGCHSIEDNDVGPRHRGVVGRPAGSVPGYSYSRALANSNIVWSPDTLDRWLQGPPKLVPGAKMFFSVAKPQDRADIIAYLGTQK